MMLSGGLIIIIGIILAIQSVQMVSGESCQPDAYGVPTCTVTTSASYPFVGEGVVAFFIGIVLIGYGYTRQEGDSYRASH